MAGPKIEATVQAIVLLAEVGHRTQIPVAIYAFSTANHFEVILDSGEPLDAEAQSRIGNLITRPSGGTEIQSALEAVRDRLASLTTTDNHLILLSDGQHNDQENPGTILRDLQRRGVRVIGLGLGPTSDALLRLLPNSRTNLEPHQVGEELAGILVAVGT
jgi:Mg-chelatase subunit ChlD